MSIDTTISDLYDTYQGPKDLPTEAETICRLVTYSVIRLIGSDDKAKTVLSDIRKHGDIDMGYWANKIIGGLYHNLNPEYAAELLNQIENKSLIAGSLMGSLRDETTSNATYEVLVRLSPDMYIVRKLIEILPGNFELAGSVILSYGASDITIPPLIGALGYKSEEIREHSADIIYSFEPDGYIVRRLMTTKDDTVRWKYVRNIFLGWGQKCLPYLNQLPMGVRIKEPVARLISAISSQSNQQANPQIYNASPT